MAPRMASGRCPSLALARINTRIAERVLVFSGCGLEPAAALLNALRPWERICAADGGEALAGALVAPEDATGAKGTERHRHEARLAPRSRRVERGSGGDQARRAAATAVRRV